MEVGFVEGPTRPAQSNMIWGVTTFDLLVASQRSVGSDRAESSSASRRDSLERKE
jgi:hypothetical protein